MCALCEKMLLDLEKISRARPRERSTLRAQQ